MLSIIGCGNLGKSIIKSAVKSGLSSNNIKVSVKSKSSATNISNQYKIKNVYTNDYNFRMIKHSEYIFLCMKPGQIKDALISFNKRLQPYQVIVSMAAGVDVEYINRFLPSRQPIIRCMPNLPIEESIGVIGLYNHNTKVEKVDSMINKIFKGSLIMKLPNEDKMDIITTLAGSGPAFISYFIDRLIKHGVQSGLTPDESELIVKQTLLGTAKMLQGGNTKDLIYKVASKGGCTEAGLNCMEENGTGINFIAGLKKSLDRVSQINRGLPE